MELPRVFDIVERTPRVLWALLDGVSPAWTQAEYESASGQRGWSAYEVVGHLVIVEKGNWLPRLRRILNEGEAKPFDAFAQESTITPVSGRPLASLLDEFTAAREANVRELRGLNLSTADFSRTGQHPKLGRVTAGHLLSTWAVHDLHHLRQIGLAMAWQYREEVGPWREFLNTLHNRPVE